MVVASPASLIDELSRVDGKAEIVGGRIVPLMTTGRMPIYAAFELAVSLRLYVRVAGLQGIAVPDNAGFIVRLPNRQSFSPDAAYYEGPNSGMKFFDGPPLFAAEIRSENDYGNPAEEGMVAKRRDYFAAGTLVVWDVDLQSDEVVRKYTAGGGSEIPVAVYRRGEFAEAETAVPGWSMAVDELFEA
jgi:Uma2 family endonuclease